MNKIQLRETTLDVLRQLSTEQYEKRSSALMQNLLRMPVVQQAQTIAITVSAFPEVHTQAIIEALWRLKKTVVVPKCLPSTREMDFYAIASFDQLERVYLHLYEPIPTETKYVAPAQIDVIIVPGVVYNKEGYRIGFGGGYYDRYLPKTPATRISLAFQEQIHATIPYAIHDCPVHYIITDNEVITC